MITLALICSVQEAYLGLAMEQPHIERISFDGNSVIAEGVMPGRKGLRAQFRRDGSIKVTGAKTKLGFDTWAELKRAHNGYELAWEMIGEYARDGTHTIASWKVGTCTPTGKSDG